MFEALDDPAPAHLGEEMARGALVYIVVLPLGLMAAATWYLFTPAARAWFRDRRAGEA
jgi:hypothetical protein